MCIVNLDLPNGICNGSTGIIKEFSNGLPVVHFNNGTIRTVGLIINGFIINILHFL